MRCFHVIGDIWRAQISTVLNALKLEKSGKSSYSNSQVMCASGCPSLEYLKDPSHDTVWIFLADRVLFALLLLSIDSLSWMDWFMYLLSSLTELASNSSEITLTLSLSIGLFKSSILIRFFCLFGWVLFGYIVEYWAVVSFRWGFPEQFYWPRTWLSGEFGLRLPPLRSAVSIPHFSIFVHAADKN